MAHRHTMTKIRRKRPLANVSCKPRNHAIIRRKMIYFLFFKNVCWSQILYKKICCVLNTAINKTKAFAANRLHSNNARKIWSEGNFISFILSNIKSKRKFKNCKCYRLGGRHSNLNKYIQRHNEYFWSGEQITICKPILFSIVCLIPVGNKQYATQ